MSQRASSRATRRPRSGTGDEPDGVPVSSDGMSSELSDQILGLRELILKHAIQARERSVIAPTTKSQPEVVPVAQDRASLPAKPPLPKAEQTKTGIQKAIGLQERVFKAISSNRSQTEKDKKDRVARTPSKKQLERPHLKSFSSRKNERTRQQYPSLPWLTYRFSTLPQSPRGCRRSTGQPTLVHRAWFHLREDGQQFAVAAFTTPFNGDVRRAEEGKACNMLQNFNVCPCKGKSQIVERKK